LAHSRRGRSRAFVFVSASVSAATLGACGGDGPLDLPSFCGNVTNLFPTPVGNANTPFLDSDDAFLEVDFAAGFEFSFYGASYTSVFLNTNGGMTFGGGDADYEIAASAVTVPAIATFWGDLDAGSAPSRAGQMTYEACADRFIVRYNQIQDFDEDALHNTAVVTLEESGKITIEYGAVLSQDILAGIFDGTHADDDSVAVADSYTGYATGSTGKVLFNGWGNGPMHTGQLTNRTIVYNP
jgi:hypothetical protein